jgi:hypothetical protein
LGFAPLGFAPLGFAPLGFAPPSFASSGLAPSGLPAMASRPKMQPQSSRPPPARMSLDQLNFQEGGVSRTVEGPFSLKLRPAGSEVRHAGQPGPHSRRKLALISELPIRLLVGNRTSRLPVRPRAGPYSSRSAASRASLDQLSLQERGASRIVKGTRSLRLRPAAAVKLVLRGGEVESRIRPVRVAGLARAGWACGAQGVGGREPRREVSPIVGRCRRIRRPSGRA